MKIICSKTEFAALVRACERGIKEETCGYCLFCKVCAQTYDPDGEEIMVKIEDICEVVQESGANG